MTELETLELAARGEHVALAVRAPDTPPGFLAIVEQLLAPDPAQRLQTAAAVLEALLALPGSPQRARRDLGALVVQMAQGRAQRDAAIRPASLELGPTQALSKAPQIPPEAHGAPSARASQRAPGPGPKLDSESIRIPGLAPHRRALFALAAALFFAAGVTAFAVLRSPPKGPPRLGVQQPARASQLAQHAGSPAAGAPTASPPTAPPRRLAPPAIVLRPEPEAGAPEHASSPSGSRKSLAASLEVVVLPYGEVFVDGKHIGPAPATLPLPPGEHSVEAKNRDGSLRRRVSLSAGEHRQIVLR
jgi:hypothetical protein